MNAKASEAKIKLAFDGAVAILTIDDLPRRNALGLDSYSLINNYCKVVNDDEAIGALVIRGAGGHFCSGAVREVLQDYGADPLATENFKILSSIYDAVFRLGDLKVPVIAAVRGSAVGAGFNIAMVADIRIVAKNANFLSGFASIGMHPGGGHFYLLERLVSREVAAAIGMFGLPISGETALKIGLAWEVLPDLEVENRAMVLAHNVAKNPALARAMKKSFVTTVNSSWAVAIDAERSVQMWTLRNIHGSND